MKSYENPENENYATLINNTSKCVTPQKEVLSHELLLYSTLSTPIYLNEKNSQTIKTSSKSNYQG